MRNVGPTVMTMARVEALEAHRKAVEVRLEALDAVKKLKGKLSEV